MAVQKSLSQVLEQLPFDGRLHVRRAAEMPCPCQHIPGKVPGLTRTARQCERNGIAHLRIGQEDFLKRFRGLHLPHDIHLTLGLRS